MEIIGKQEKHGKRQGKKQGNRSQRHEVTICALRLALPQEEGFAIGLRGMSFDEGMFLDGTRFRKWFTGAGMVGQPRRMGIFM